MAPTSIAFIIILMNIGKIMMLWWFVFQNLKCLKGSLWSCQFDHSFESSHLKSSTAMCLSRIPINLENPQNMLPTVFISTIFYQRNNSLCKLLTLRHPPTWGTFVACHDCELWIILSNEMVFVERHIAVKFFKCIFTCCDYHK